MRIDRAHRGLSSLDTRLLTNFPFCSLQERRPYSLQVSVDDVRLSSQDRDILPQRAFFDAVLSCCPICSGTTSNGSFSLGMPQQIEQMLTSIAPLLTRPPPNGRRVGIRIVTFNGCAGFPLASLPMFPNLEVPGFVLDGVETWA